MLGGKLKRWQALKRVTYWAALLSTNANAAAPQASNRAPNASMRLLLCDVVWQLSHLLAARRVAIGVVGASDAAAAAGAAARRLARHRPNQKKDSTGAEPGTTFKITMNTQFARVASLARFTAHRRARVSAAATAANCLKAPAKSAARHQKIAPAGQFSPGAQQSQHCWCIGSAALRALEIAQSAALCSACALQPLCRCCCKSHLR